VEKQNKAVQGKLVRIEVIALTNDEAKRQGIDPARYKITAVDFGSTTRKNEWTVSYHLNTQWEPPGGHFLVWVDDNTKTCKLMRGE
jgi:hypothetical protein